ncbi:DUF3667 domain-containing protein [Caulobacter sp. S45]|uniref:DUF3667 domain-containing protein n=1 Tax=Caulobacter sp. S45 TaxID=1641861 RepID=UPI001577532B|nr:DUF3667 domain-containing protein [Caulobacter sp. S45]
MDRVLELAAVDAAASEAAHDGAAHPAHTHTTCLNCDAQLHGRYCHACGQSSDDHHRSILHLLWEAVEGFTHLDGRLARTVPALLFRPGQLARDHIEGRRQRHVPPFRLFLVTLLVFMFTAEFAINHGGQTTKTVQDIKVRSSFQVGDQKVEVVRAQDAKAIVDHDAPHDGLGRWLRDHIRRAANNREYYLMLVFEWAHRLAVLTLPILAGLLTLCYVYKRQFYVYDHLVVAMQYLSFCFLVWAPVWLFPKAISDWLFLIALAWTPFNLYQILRSAYGSRRIGAAAKALVLWSSTVVVFGAMLTGLLAYALNQM